MNHGISEFPPDHRSSLYIWFIFIYSPQKEKHLLEKYKILGTTIKWRFSTPQILKRQYPHLLKPENHRGWGFATMTIGRDDQMPETLQGHRGWTPKLDGWRWGVDFLDFLYPFLPWSFFRFNGKQPKKSEMKGNYHYEIHTYFCHFPWLWKGPGTYWIRKFELEGPQVFKTHYNTLGVVQVGGWFPSEFPMSTIFGGSGIAKRTYRN